MRTIIAGSRKGIVRQDVEDAMESCPFESQILTVLCGRARGVDIMGQFWAKDRNIPVLIFPADWDRFHKRAGFIRNQQMAENADALVLVWDGKSRGSKDMLQRAERLGLKIHIWIPERYEQDEGIDYGGSGQARLI